MPTKMIASPCRKLWCTKYWMESNCRKLWYWTACKKLNFITKFFFEILQRQLFWELWECLTISIKNHSINLQETFMLICIQKLTSKLTKLTSSLTSFLTYCKEIANLLVWVIWICLDTHISNDGINLKKPCLCTGKKSTSSFSFSLDIATILETCHCGYSG